VPVAPVFAAAAEVREGEDSAALEPDGAADGEGRGQADVEAAVAVEEGFVRLFEVQALFVDDEHGDFGAVFAGDEDLFGLVAVRSEIDIGAAEEGALSGGEIEAVDGTGFGETGEAVKGRFVLAPAVKSASRADPGEGDFADECA